MIVFVVVVVIVLLMVFDLYLKLVMDDIVIDILNWFVY